MRFISLSVIIAFMGMGTGKAALNLSNRTLHKNPHKTCVGYCDRNINCARRDQQGCYNWCQKHCTDKSIPRHKEYLAALDTCDHGPLQHPYRGRVIAEDISSRRFTIEIINARPEFLERIGQMAHYPLTEQNQVNLKTGDILEFDELSTVRDANSLPADWRISSNPVKVKSH